MLLLYILSDDRPIFMISGSNEQLLQELEYTLLKPDCHSWWISKLQSATLEERYAIKFCFKLGKNATEMLPSDYFWSILHESSISFEWHKRFKEGRESVGYDEKNATEMPPSDWKSIHQSWLAKGLGLGLLYWGFKGVQGEIPSEAASSLQIGSVAFPAGQCTSQKLHPYHRLFEQDGNQDSSSASLQSRPCFCDIWLFP